MMRRFLTLLFLLLASPALAQIHGSVTGTAVFSGGSPSPTLAFTTLSGAAVSSTTTGGGTYTVAAPSGLASTSWGGGCTGSSTVSGFTASGGTWSATFTTPTSGGTGCTLTTTGTGANTASATSPGVAITGGSTTITGVTLSNSSFASGASSGTAIGTVGVNTTGSGFTGTLSITGSNASSFQLSGTTLETNGSLACSSYSINIVATQSGATGSPYSQPETITCAANNAFYPLAQASYSCTTSYYVNNAGGSDSYNGTAQTFTSGSTGPWATISHAESQLAGSHPGYCINVAPSTTAYNTDVLLQMYGSSNTTTGYATLRCAANSSTATARPYLYWITAGAQGSNPGCAIVGSGDNPLGGIVAVSNGSTIYNYTIVDGFEIHTTQNYSFSVTGLSYNSTTGLATLTLGSSTVLEPEMGVNISGITGSGFTGTSNECTPISPSNSSPNGCFFAAPGTSGTTLTLQLATGLSLTYASGGTVTFPEYGDQGIGGGAGNVNPGAHHMVAINNFVHDLGGAGIASLYGDDIFWVGNVVYNTSWTSSYDESNFGMVENINASYTAGALDGTYGTIPGSGAVIRNIIANNISYNAGNTVGPQSDGNSYIIDSTNDTQSTCTSTYSYGTLMYGNIGFHSGGKGVHIFYSGNVAALNNTSFQNNQSTLNNGVERADIDSQCGDNNYVANNIAYGATGSGYLVANVAMGSYSLSTSAGDYELGTSWLNNIADMSGTLYSCSSIGSSGTGVVCYNNLSTIYNAAAAPSSWASGTTYAQFAHVSGSDSNAYGSLAAGNVGHNPVGGGGTYWQNNGAPNNSYPTNPVFTAASTATPSVVPNLTLGSGSPALGASTAAVTALGGPTVATPNIGAY